MPPDPAVTTTVRLLFVHGLPGGGSGLLGGEAVRLSEKSEVRQTSGNVPASWWLIEGGLRPSLSSSATTKSE